MSFLDFAAGTGQGLEDLLKRHREEELMRQHQQQINETVRSNQAHEALGRDTLSENVKLRQQTEQDRRQAAIDAVTAKAETAGIKKKEDYLKGFATIPGGENSPEFSVAGMNEATTMGIPPQRFNKGVPIPQDFTGPIQEGEPQRGEPSHISLRATPTEIHGQESIDAANTRANESVAGANQRSSDAIAAANQRSADAIAATNERARLAADARAANAPGVKPPASVVQQRNNAKNVRSHVQEISQQAEALNKLGLMGPVGGRWGEFLAGRIGSADLAANPQQQELLEEFRTSLGLLKSGMAMVHGGARGGGSPAIMARMDALINSDKMNLPLFKGALKSFDSWLHQYEGPDEAGGGGGTPAADVGGGLPPGVTVRRR